MLFSNNITKDVNIIRKYFHTGFIAFIITINIIALASFNAISISTILFQDDFESGKIDYWTSSNSGINNSYGNFTVVSGNLTGSGAHILELKQEFNNNWLTGEELLLKDPQSLLWENYAYEIDIIFENTTAGYGVFLFYMQSNDDMQNCYYVIIKSLQDNIVLGKTENNISTVLESISTEINIGVLYHLNIQVNHGNISIFIQNELVIESYDTSFKSGTIGFGASGSNYDYNYVITQFDNIVVSQLVQESSLPVEYIVIIVVILCVATITFFIYKKR